MVKSKKAVKKQRGGKDEPSNAKQDEYEYEDDFEAYNANANTQLNSLPQEEFRPEYDEFQLDMLKGMIRTATKSNKKEQQIRNCMDVKTLMQHEFGICYYVSLIHSMFFSRGMRRYIGRQIKYLESKLLATQEYEDYKWFFIMLWNMIERPTFYKNFNWTYDLCYNLGTSLVASCKLMEVSGETFGYNQSHIDKSGLVFTLGYNYFITNRTSLNSASQGGYVGEALKPVLCSLEMNNVLFLTVERYDYSKQQALTYHLSKILKKYKEIGIKVDIIALKVYPENYVKVENNFDKTYKVAEELSLNGILYTLDSAQFQSKTDNTGSGHVIAGITCPYANGNKYPKLVLNSWTDNDVIEADWNNSHIVIKGTEMKSYNTYTEAIDAYNNNKELSGNVQQERPEAYNLLFSANQTDCLYFYTREETSKIDKIDEQRITENVLTKASMILGEKPEKVSPNGDKSDMNNYYLDMFFKLNKNEKADKNGNVVEEHLKNIGLTNDFYKIKEINNERIVISVKYNKFIEICQERLGLVEDILVMTGKVPIDIVVDDATLLKQGIQSGGDNTPLPPSKQRWTPNVNKGPSILNTPVVNKMVRYVYFGVKGEISQEVIERYLKENFIIQIVNQTGNKLDYVSVLKGNGYIERLLKPDLTYYKFEYDKYINLLVKGGNQSGGIKRRTKSRKTKVTKK
jgi:hypothetical protein